MINHAKNIARSAVRQLPRELIKEATFASATGTAPLADPVELERMEKLGSLFSDSASRVSSASPSPSPSPSGTTTTVTSPIAASRSSSTGSAYAQQGDPFGGGRRILRKSRRSKRSTRSKRSKRSKRR